MWMSSKSSMSPTSFVRAPGETSFDERAHPELVGHRLHRLHGVRLALIRALRRRINICACRCAWRLALGAWRVTVFWPSGNPLNREARFEKKTKAPLDHGFGAKRIWLREKLRTICGKPLHQVPEHGVVRAQWSRGALVVPRRVGRTPRRGARCVLPRHLPGDAVVGSALSDSAATSPKRLAAMRRPGVGGRTHGGSPETTIAKMHGRFLESSRRALCGHELSAGEFADAVDRVAATLNVEMSEAVRVVFGEPSLVAASEADIVRRLVELRGTHENEDIASLVVASEGALLADAAHVECVPSSDRDDRTARRSDRRERRRPRGDGPYHIFFIRNTRERARDDNDAHDDRDAPPRAPRPRPGRETRLRRAPAQRGPPVQRPGSRRRSSNTKRRPRGAASSARGAPGAQCDPPPVAAPTAPTAPTVRARFVGGGASLLALDAHAPTKPCAESCCAGASVRAGGAAALVCAAATATGRARRGAPGFPPTPPVRQRPRAGAARRSRRAGAG